MLSLRVNIDTDHERENVIDLYRAMEIEIKHRRAQTWNGMSKAAEIALLHKHRDARLRQIEEKKETTKHV